jgi:hypothetical protein
MNTVLTTKDREFFITIDAISAMTEKTFIALGDNPAETFVMVGIFQR